MEARAPRVWTLAAALLVALLPSCGGGGGGGVPSAPTAAVTTPPTTTPPATTPPASGAAPTLRYTVDRRAGRSPLTVGFSLCESTDASGGKNLTYLADFEGTGYVTLAGCGVSHDYRSSGVSVWDTRLAVRDAAGQLAEAEVVIKAYVDVAIQVDRTPCDQISASAVLLAQAFRVQAEVDKVQFEAFNAAGQSISKLSGEKQSSTKWVTGPWKVNDNGKVRVRATVFARNVAGDDTPEELRPGCGP